MQLHRHIALVFGLSISLAVVLMYGCGPGAPPVDPAVKQQAEESKAKEIWDWISLRKACDWAGKQLVHWDPDVLRQIEHAQLPKCAQGCGPQPPDQYGCNTDECRFYFSRCTKNKMLEDLTNLTARIETINRMISGEDKSQRGTLVAQLAQRLWAALFEGCADIIMADARSHPQKIFSVPPNRQAVKGINMTDAYAKRMCTDWSTVKTGAGLSAQVAHAFLQCGIPAMELMAELLRVLEDQFKYKGGCYGSYNQEWHIEVVRLLCQLVQVLNKCRTVDLFAKILKPVNDFIQKNPYLRGLIWGCEGFLECQQDLLCKNFEKACKFQTIATRPYECMTATQNYSCDLHCCCRKGGTWSIGPEHKCLVEGGFMRPGTCGVADPTQRAAWHLPVSADECQQFDINPQAWGPVGDPALRCVSACACPTPPTPPPAGFTCAAGTCPAQLTIKTPCYAATDVETGLTTSTNCKYDGGTPQTGGGGQAVPGDGGASAPWVCVAAPCQLFADGTRGQDCPSCGDWCSEDYVDDWCGNGTCGYQEDSDGCPQDCPPMSATFCGDGACEDTDGEDATTCPEDCADAPAEDVCGDEFCGMSEDATRCPQDCPDVPNSDECGNGICSPDELEAGTCPDDCYVTYCGDGVCNGDETIDWCPEDCTAAGGSDGGDGGSDGGGGGGGGDTSGGTTDSDGGTTGGGGLPPSF
jgi:hypothetical protein